MPPVLFSGVFQIDCSDLRMKSTQQPIANPRNYDVQLGHQSDASLILTQNHSASLASLYYTSSLANERKRSQRDLPPCLAFEAGRISITLAKSLSELQYQYQGISLEFSDTPFTGLLVRFIWMALYSSGTFCSELLKLFEGAYFHIDFFLIFPYSAC